MHGVTASQLRHRIDQAMELLRDARVTQHEKMFELLAILSDTQLWIQDQEEKEKQNGPVQTRS